jgi:hypothetical protein
METRKEEHVSKDNVKSYIALRALSSFVLLQQKPQAEADDLVTACHKASSLLMQTDMYSRYVTRWRSL